MALFGGKEPATIGELIARKRYPQAIDSLRAQLLLEQHNTKLRMQLADVLVMAGRGGEAVPVLIRLSDEFASEGLVARAMALLKKVQRIEPHRPDVDARIASFARGTEVAARMAAEAITPYGVGKSHPETYEMHTRDVEVEAIEHVAPVGEPQFGIPTVFDTEPPPASGASAQPQDVPGIDEERAAAAFLRKELLDTMGDLEPAARAATPRKRVGTPLFSSLSQDELLAVFRGLRLLTFEPGDLILLQGDEGDRMFVITSGRCKVFTKEPGGRRNVLVGTLDEGAFFGELSLLRGAPRPNTVIAATDVDLLELERSSLESLCRTYPRVRDVLEDFAQEHIVAQNQALGRRQRHGTAMPAAPETPPVE